VPPESAAHAVELPVSKLRSVAIGTSMTTYRKQGRAQDFSVGAKIEGPKAECEEVVLGKGQQPPHLQLRGLGELCELPAGFEAEPRSLKGFPLFSALRTASPDTIILLIVDYYAAIGGKTPLPRNPCENRTMCFG